MSRTLDLTPRQWWIIADMVELQPRTATELAAMADVDKGLLSRNLKVLAARGYVAVERDKIDHRQQILSLTDEGRAIYKRGLPIMEERNRNLVKDVSDEDYAVFLRVLDAIDAAAVDAAERLEAAEEEPARPVTTEEKTAVSV
ncbi:MAG: MarR family winged helix-turn-helix transcriptional regulator [Pseudomonadota bacterium]